jgi:hypothetical protein
MEVLTFLNGITHSEMMGLSVLLKVNKNPEWQAFLHRDVMLVPDI